MPSNLEFDGRNARAVFAPLADVADGKQVVLGHDHYEASRTGGQSHRDSSHSRGCTIHPLDRLCLSPQCGFASCEIGNKLTEEQQWAKIVLVQEIAREVWG